MGTTGTTAHGGLTAAIAANTANEVQAIKLSALPSLTGLTRAATSWPTQFLVSTLVTWNLPMQWWTYRCRSPRCPDRASRSSWDPVASRAFSEGSNRLRDGCHPPARSSLWGPPRWLLTKPPSWQPRCLVGDQVGSTVSKVCVAPANATNITGNRGNKCQYGIV
jgi:hypothetical protein